MEDFEGTLCKFLIILPVSINIKYLKSLQTNDFLRVVDCIKSSQQMELYLKNQDVEWGSDMHSCDYLFNIVSNEINKINVMLYHY